MNDDFGISYKSVFHAPMLWRLKSRLKARWESTWWFWIPLVWRQIWTIDMNDAPPAYWKARAWAEESFGYDTVASQAIDYLIRFTIAVRATLALLYMPVRYVILTIVRFCFTVPWEHQWYSSTWQQRWAEHEAKPLHERYGDPVWPDWEWPRPHMPSGEHNYDPDNKWGHSNFFVIAYGKGRSGYCIDCIGHHNWDEVHLDPRWWSLLAGIHTESSC